MISQKIPKFSHCAKNFSHVSVIEDCEVQPEVNPSEATYGLVLAFGGGQFQHLASYTENERDSWIAALRSASHSQMRSHLEELRSRLKAKTMNNSSEPQQQQQQQQQITTADTNYNTNLCY